MLNSHVVSPRVSAKRKPPVKSERPVSLPERFQLLVDCRDEAGQRALYEELARRGVKCRVWVV